MQPDFHHGLLGVASVRQPDRLWLRPKGVRPENRRAAVPQAVARCGGL